ncbi:hypothetical protein ACWDYJ_06125 [Streptomyces sp. NPDC003042]
MLHRIVVGAAGFIGRPLAAHLAAQQGRLLLIDSEPAGPPTGTVQGWHAVDCPTEPFTQLVDGTPPDGADRRDALATSSDRGSVGELGLA